MFRCEEIESGKLAKEWQAWKNSLKYFFEASQVSNQKIMRSKMLHLGGPQLQKVFSSLEGTDDFPSVVLEKRWYDLAIERLDAYFKPRRQDVLERHRLRCMKQGPNERFSHYVLRLRQQPRDCGLEKSTAEVRAIMEEIMLVDVIVEGCTSQKLRRKILEKDQSLSDIEALGESLKSFRIQEQELKAGKALIESGFGEVNKVQRVVNTRKERRENRIMSRFPTASSFLNKQMRVCFNCGLEGHFSKYPLCPARNKTCRRCKKVGHFESVCRKRPAEHPVSTPATKVHVVEEMEEDVSKTPRPESQPGCCRTAAEKKVYYTFYTGSDKNVFSCVIGGVNVEVFIDSGSDVNLITSETWEKLKAEQVVITKCERGSSKVFRAYASKVPINILGSFQALIRIGERSLGAEFLVVKNGQRNLLGDTTSKQLGILKIGLEVNEVKNNMNEDAPFSKITNKMIRLSMVPTVTPVFQPLRRIPMPLEGAVNEKLDELLRKDIIEPKEGPATWVSPLMVANKANGSIRLCVDLRRVNQAVIRERHPMPVIDDVLAKIGKGKVWSILDVKDAFFLLELEEESRDIVTFITHRGLYRFKRIPFGLVSAPETFQRTMDEILANCEGTYWYLDDVGVEGSTVEEHDWRLNKVCYDK
ncbi:uncharacterized protein K02A2.6-like [Wyeomyia smithii]|uniref:uncharacterized protein K02A2.6-like n=1 Tax=Wyeomyia smithii TaxID=174621 RepID=UPI002467BBD5|nr:uncharacterized protein K02A2.6-like [Wyeomyia smithii]